MEYTPAELESRLLRVIELANLRVSVEADTSRRSQYQTIATNFMKLQHSLREGRLPPIGATAGFGAGRALSEWELDDDELCRAVADAERLYRGGD